MCIRDRLYTLLLGWGVLANIVPFQSVYLLMALPCAAPIIWYGYGFVKVNEATQDFGLLLSALGWSFIAISLLVRHTALNADWLAYQQGAQINNLGDSTAAKICTLIGLLCIAVGAIMAFQAWSREMRRNSRF